MSLSKKSSDELNEMQYDLNSKALQIQGTIQQAQKELDSIQFQLRDVSMELISRVQARKKKREAAEEAEKQKAIRREKAMAKKQSKI